MKISKQTQGKRNRQAGARWELKVRADLEKKGWFVSKFQNTVELTELWSGGQRGSTDKPLGYGGKMIPAKRKYNPFKKVFALGTGFPDFICWKMVDGDHFEIIGVECKSNGYLDKIEKDKCEWLLANDVFDAIDIAKKKRICRKIVPEYIEFVSKSQENPTIKSINKSLEQASEGKIRRIA